MKTSWLSRKLLEVSVDELERILLREYQKLSDKLMSYITDLYISITDPNGVPLNSKLYQYNKYYDLLNKIQEEMTKLGLKENKTFDKKLVELYEKNTQILDKQFNLASNLRSEDVLAICKEDWVGDGMNFSDRIWKDKQALAATLQEELVECVATGKSVDRMTKVLMERFDVSYNNARRLARTELQRVYNQSCLDKYKRMGIEKVQISEADDSRTCEECRALNKQIFPLNEAPMLPIHPNCRGTYLAVIE